MANSAEPLLSVRGVTVRFGGIVALDSVGFDVKRGDICGLIGPNGAGKTTLFNCMSRLYDYQSGDILFEGKSITATKTHRIAAVPPCRSAFRRADYSVRMLAACGPLAPCLTSNSTRWFSCRVLKPLPVLISLK